jgi:GNAT superfamily N-acetyltransferase
MTLEVQVRPLTAGDCHAYRALRQRIYRSKDARFFSDSYEREARLTEPQWREWCEEKPEHCILGTFNGDELVGILMITRQGDLKSPVVEWEAVWLDPRFRRTKAGGKQFAEHAREWTKDRGYKYAAVFIRDEYTPSRDHCRGMGFTHLYTIPSETWADGSVEDTEGLILDLRPNAREFAGLPLEQRFKEALPYLNQGLHAPPRPSIVRKPPHEQRIFAVA